MGGRVQCSYLLLMNLISADQALAKCLFLTFVQEQYGKGDVLWKQSDLSSFQSN
jgi:hypothetical protein